MDQETNWQKDKDMTLLTPEDCKLIAHNTGEGWYLAVQNPEGDDIAILKWPWGNNDKKNAKQLEEYGYEIV